MTLADEAPSDLTVFYDPLAYSAFDHPYEVYRQLRDRSPVYYNARRDLYVVSRYEDVKACLCNHEQMINALGNDMDGTHDSYGAGNLVAQDSRTTPCCGTWSGHRSPAGRSWPWRRMPVTWRVNCWRR